ncbi:MAG: chorismate synthase [Candidatus Sumerlaeia bacterium]|nr:chorismate synthase [Candidatus Sumerlaeia bacterium]
MTYQTAGESHGPALTAIVSGLPAGLDVSLAEINAMLARRQQGHGRGGRMKIETDTVDITAGVRHGKTLGSPVALMVRNADWKNWGDRMAIEPLTAARRARLRKDKLGAAVTQPRPGHVDLAGILKWDHSDVRNVLERASARATATQVAVGAICKQLLREFGIEVLSHMVQLGDIHADCHGLTYAQIMSRALRDADFHCADPRVRDRMFKAVDAARRRGDTLGGVNEVIAVGAPPGLGSCMNWSDRLDARLAGALMGVQAMKGVEIGMGFETARRLGSEVHDEILPRRRRSPLDIAYDRNRNNAGGLEGGITNGQPIVVRVAQKPISTLMRPLCSVDIKTHQAVKAVRERSDTTAVPAGGVICEAVVAIVLAQAFLEKFGGDSMREIRRNHLGYLRQIARR